MAASKALARAPDLGRRRESGPVLAGRTCFALALSAFAWWIARDPLCRVVAWIARDAHAWLVPTPVATDFAWNEAGRFVIESGPLLTQVEAPSPALELVVVLPLAVAIACPRPGARIGDHLLGVAGVLVRSLVAGGLLVALGLTARLDLLLQQRGVDAFHGWLSKGLAAGLSVGWDLATVWVPGLLVILAALPSLGVSMRSGSSGRARRSMIALLIGATCALHATAELRLGWAARGGLIASLVARRAEGTGAYLLARARDEEARGVFWVARGAYASAARFEESAPEARIALGRLGVR